MMKKARLRPGQFAFVPTWCVFVFLGLAGKAAEEEKGVGAKEGEAKVERLAWKPGLFDAELKKGKIVWLTFTADWCLLCQRNQARVLEDQKVLKRLKELGVVLIVADLTEPDPKMRQALEALGQTSVPTNLIAEAASKNRFLFPEVLSVEVVLEALNEFEEPQGREK